MPKSFTLDEVMYILGLTRSQILRLVAYGKLERSLVDRRLVFLPATLQKYLFNMESRLYYAMTHDHVEDTAATR